tara:strand:+ start:54 stop:269 length:216 start_codon:yes stop_codon:yes gene_type:complete
MSQVIKIKRSETASSVPSTGDLATHEIAMNVYDKKIFTKKSDGSIVTIAEANAESAGITEDDALALAIALG